MVIPHWMLLRMKNFSDKSCRENKNTHFIQNNVIYEIVPSKRQCGSMWYSRTSHI